MGNKSTKNLEIMKKTQEKAKNEMKSINPLANVNSINNNGDGNSATLLKQIASLQSELKQEKIKSDTLYSEIVQGSQPRWDLIECCMDNRILRDRELHELRLQVNGLYQNGLYVVKCIQSHVGNSEYEQSILEFIRLNGEYKVNAETIVHKQHINLHRVIQKYQILSHDRIADLSGEHGE